MATKSKKKAAKKSAPSSGAAEIKALKAAIAGLKAAGSALAKAVKANKELRSKAAVGSALDSASNAVVAIKKSVGPTGPPTSIL